MSGSFFSGNGSVNIIMCTLGEVFKAALPSGLKLESETRVMAMEVTAEIPDLTMRKH